MNGEIAEKVIRKEFADFRALDNFLIQLDGTPNKSRLGANAILAVSMSVVCAAAKSENLELWQFLSEHSGSKLEAQNSKLLLPMPLMNIINGGAHADNPLDIQECMIVPVGASTMAERVRMGAEVFHHLKKILSKRGLATSVGDEGGFAPMVNSTDDALATIIEAITSAGYTTEQVKIALDVASTEFFKD